jgi:hypothetical protein
MSKVWELWQRAIQPLRRGKDAVDSEVTSSFFPISDFEREINLERSIQTLARDHFGVQVKAAVFKRIRPDRGHVLAMLRMLSPESEPPKDPEKFIHDLVNAFNYRAEHTLQKHIDYAIWSDLDTRPIQVRMQQEVVQRAP